jgi:hypothetical protein
MPDTPSPTHQREPQASNLPSAACRQCRGSFSPRAAWQHFCSTACRREWHKANKGKRIRLVDLERRIADLEARVTVLDDPTRS